MLSPRLTDYSNHTTAAALLTDIDKRLAELANSQYNNIVFSLNYPIPVEALDDLLHYKQILTYKSCNPRYACPYTIEMIASRVQVLIRK
jgi:hypothetical protein